ncbi:hypothetical protein PZA11_002424 [Diplocarpon coronariae]
MEADERTQLLAKPATDRALYSQQWDAEGAEPLRSSRPFGLWQTGALFGKPFLGQVPIAAVCCLLTARGLRKFLPLLDQEDEQHIIDGPKPDFPEFDYPGAITLAIGLTSFLAVIDLQNQLSWTHPVILSTTILGTLSLLAFLLFETYPGNRQLLIPLRLLRTGVGAFCVGQVSPIGPSFNPISGLITFQAITAMSLSFSINVTAPSATYNGRLSWTPYFANTQGISDAEAGGHIAPSSFGNAIGNLIAGQIIKKHPITLMILVGLDRISLHLLLGTWAGLEVFPFGLFAGVVLSTQFIGLYNRASKQEMATAISMYYMSQQIGIALGISLTSSLLNQQFQSMLQNFLADIPNHSEIIRRILADSSVVETLPAEVQSLVSQSFLKSFWLVPGMWLDSNNFMMAFDLITHFSVRSCSSSDCNTTYGFHDRENVRMIKLWSWRDLRISKLSTTVMLFESGGWILVLRYTLKMQGKERVWDLGGNADA